jgi:hypothetical protein
MGGRVLKRPRKGLCSWKMPELTSMQMPSGFVPPTPPPQQPNTRARTHLPTHPHPSVLPTRHADGLLVSSPSAAGSSTAKGKATAPGPLKKRKAPPPEPPLAAPPPTGQRGACGEGGAALPMQHEGTGLQEKQELESPGPHPRVLPPGTAGVVPSPLAAGIAAGWGPGWGPSGPCANLPVAQIDAEVPFSASQQPQQGVAVPVAPAAGVPPPPPLTGLRVAVQPAMGVPPLPPPPPPPPPLPAGRLSNCIPSPLLPAPVPPPAMPELMVGQAFPILGGVAAVGGTALVKQNGSGAGGEVTEGAAFHAASLRARAPAPAALPLPVEDEDGAALLSSPVSAALMGKLPTLAVLHERLAAQEAQAQVQQQQQ